MARTSSTPSLASMLIPQAPAPTPVMVAGPSDSIGSGSPSLSSLLTAIASPTAAAAVTAPSSVQAPKILFTPKAAPDFSSFNNPILNDISKEWQEEGYNPNGFDHYAAPDGSGLPFVGPNYLKSGAQAGMFYNPYTDSYSPNINSLIGVKKAEGDLPKTPSLLDQLFPTLATVGATAGIGALAKDGIGSLFSSSTPANSVTQPGLLSQGWTALSNLFDGSGTNYGPPTAPGSSTGIGSLISALGSGGTGTTFGSDASAQPFLDQLGTNGDTSSLSSLLDSGADSSGPESAFATALLNYAGTNTALGAGGADALNIGANAYEGNWPGAAIDAVQDAPTLWGDVSKGISDVGSGISKVFGGL